MCGSANAKVGPDYTGELQARLQLRLTDRYNEITGGNGTDAGTIADGPFPLTIQCSDTASDLGVGSVCTVATSANALLPGAVGDAKRAVWALGQVQVFDGGADGVASTQSANDLFAVQGLFIP